MTTAPGLSLSRRVRSTPFEARVLAAGVSAFTVYNHMCLPAAFESLADDYWHLVRNVQLWDVAAERQVEIVGPHALTLLELMTPREVSRAEVGQCIYAPLVDESGGIVNDPLILRLAGDRFWISVADSDVLLWARGLAAGRGLDVSISEPDVSPLAIQGPRADDVAAGVFGSWVRELGFFRFREIDLDGVPLLVARSGWSKQGGFEVYLRDGTRGLDLWDRIAAAGEPFGIRAGCPNLIERIESRLLSYGNDMTLENNPFECGLERYCHLDKSPEYLGREALARVVAEGPRRRLAYLVIDGEPIDPAARAWTVRAASEPAGIVTSAVYSPRLRANIAFAMLEAAQAVPGNALEVELPASGPRTATVVSGKWPG